MKNPFLRTHISNLIVIGSLALAPVALAVDPPPDGGYPNFNTAEGENALFNLDTSHGAGNTAIGAAALFSDTTGAFNTAIGNNALLSNTTGFVNTAIGSDALELNTTGVGNTAIGSTALYFNATGYNNTATGSFALQFNTTGNENTANGRIALQSNTTGSNNTATGSGALSNNTRGFNDTSVGSLTMQNNTSGFNNTAIGYYAMGGNRTGSYNTVAGFQALFSNTTGSSNIALGTNAGSNLTTGSNNIDISDRGIAGESNTIRIGRQGTQTTTFIAGISGATVAGGVTVVVDSTGHLGTVVSSERFKDNIKPMDNASEAILALKPVTFRYKPELDPKGIPQFGLVAEDVEKVSPALVARDADGKAFTVRYEAVNAMLLNEFLKEHRKVEEQAATITDLKSAVAQQQKDIATLTTALKAQAAQIQKVSDLLGTQTLFPRVVTNN